MSVTTWDNRYLINPGQRIRLSQLNHLIDGFKGSTRGSYYDGGIVTNSVDSFHITRFTNSNHLDDGTELFLLPFRVNSTAIDPVHATHSSSGDVYSFSVYAIKPSEIRSGLLNHFTSMQPDPEVAFITCKYGPLLTPQMTISDADQYLTSNTFILSSILPITNSLGIDSQTLFNDVFEEIQFDMVAAADRDVWISTDSVTYKTTTPYLYMDGAVLTGTSIDVDLFTSIPPIVRSSVTSFEGASTETSISYTITASTTPMYDINYETIWFILSSVNALHGRVVAISNEVDNHETRIQALENSPSIQGNFITL